MLSAAFLSGIQTSAAELCSRHSRCRAAVITLAALAGPIWFLGNSADALSAQKRIEQRQVHSRIFVVEADALKEDENHLGRIAEFVAKWSGSIKEKIIFVAAETGDQESFHVSGVASGEGEYARQMNVRMRSAEALRMLVELAADSGSLRLGKTMQYIKRHLKNHESDISRHEYGLALSPWIKRVDVFLFGVLLHKGEGPYPLRRAPSESCFADSASRSELRRFRTADQQNVHSYFVHDYAFTGLPPEADGKRYQIPAEKERFLHYLFHPNPRDENERSTLQGIIYIEEPDNLYSRVQPPLQSGECGDVDYDMTARELLPSQPLVGPSVGSAAVGSLELAVGEVLRPFTTPSGAFTHPAGAASLSLTIRSLPNGLHYSDNRDGTATLFGVPEQSGYFDALVIATDGNGLTASQTLPIRVEDKQVANVGPTKGPGHMKDRRIRLGGPQRRFVTPSDYFHDDAGSENLALSAHDLPPGFQARDLKDGRLVIEGKAEKPGSHQVRVEARDQQGEAFERSFKIEVVAAAKRNIGPQIGSAPMPTWRGVLNEPFEERVPSGAFSDDDGTENLFISGLSLPPGLIAEDQGDGSLKVSGVPTTEGEFNLIIQAKDRAGVTIARQLKMVVLSRGAPAANLSPSPVIRRNTGNSLSLQLLWQVKVDFDLHIFTPEFKGEPRAEESVAGHFWPKSADPTRRIRDVFVGSFRSAGSTTYESVTIAKGGAQANGLELIPGRYAFYVELVSGPAELCGKQVDYSYRGELPNGGRLVSGMLKDLRQITVECRGGGKPQGVFEQLIEVVVK